LGRDPQEGLDILINGQDGEGGITDIKLYINAYGYSGN
jgi:hypothetical protein